MKSRIKRIRVFLFALLLLIIMGIVDAVIVEYVNVMKIRNIIAEVQFFVLFLLLVIFWKRQKRAASQVTKSDIFMIAILVLVIIMSFVSLWNSNLFLGDTVNDFLGNNGYTGYYTTHAKGYRNLGIALENSIKNKKKKRNFDKLEEIYRMQVGENLFVYYKEDDKNIVEFAFLKQDDLYYGLGYKSAYVLPGDEYTAEETIKEDIVHTMTRGDYDELAAPAWGIAAEEQIFSMTINGKKADNMILINENAGKKYYFWILSDLGEIKTVDDVKAAKIEMNGLQ